MVCSIWLFINVLFEVAQRYGNSISKFIIKWFDKVFLLENLESYFLKKTFDYFDIFGCFAGAAIAYFVLLKSTQARR